jgi:hypothetical protein
LEENFKINKGDKYMEIDILYPNPNKKSRGKQPEPTYIFNYPISKEATSKKVAYVFIDAIIKKRINIYKNDDNIVEPKPKERNVIANIQSLSDTQYQITIIVGNDKIGEDNKIVEIVTCDNFDQAQQLCHNTYEENKERLGQLLKEYPFEYI